MPRSAYFKGEGRSVYADMVRRYGPVKGKKVFYATANRRELAPKRRVRRKRS